MRRCAARRQLHQPAELFRTVLTTLVVHLVVLVVLAGAFVRAQLDPPVAVYDDVLAPDTLRTLADAALDWKPQPGYYFEHPLPDGGAGRNYLEQTLDQILREIHKGNSGVVDGVEEPGHFYVEYWTRSVWTHIMVHADMDEGWRRIQEERGASAESYFKYPQAGHVLYLKVGKRVRGPTCVFNATGGQELLAGGGSGSSATTTEMTVVPARENRLLRFKGDLLHAVPRPGDLFVNPVNEDETTEPFEEWGRLVLLFNVWPMEEGLLAHKRVDAEGATAAISHSGPAPPFPIVNPFRDWRAAPVVDAVQTQPPSEFIQFVLMGDRARRGTERPHVFLRTSVESEDVFLEEVQPSRILMQPLQPRKKKAWYSDLASFMGIEL